MDEKGQPLMVFPQATLFHETIVGSRHVEPSDIMIRSDFKTSAAMYPHYCGLKQIAMHTRSFDDVHLPSWNWMREKVFISCKLMWDKLVSHTSAYKCMQRALLCFKNKSSCIHSSGYDILSVCLHAACYARKHLLSRATEYGRTCFSLSLSLSSTFFVTCTKLWDITIPPSCN